MEVIFLLALVLAVFLIINILSGKIQEVNLRFESIKDELLRMRRELELLRQQGQDNLARPPKPIKDAGPEPVVSGVSVPEPVPAEPEISPVPPASNIPLLEEIPEKTVAEKAEKPIETVWETAEKVQEPAEAEAEAEAGKQEWIEQAEPLYTEQEPGFFQRFMQNNPDLEKFIGENLINKIGIAILVLGIGYFVKFAIDKDWINEIGRVFIGILAGGILIGLAHRLRKSFSAFSSVLVGGGLAVLYFTIAIAFHEYQLFSQTAAFLIMVVITGFAVLLSVSYNRVELAVLAILGGFSTPFMVSTGEGNYVVLFTYVLILNAGMLVLAYLKNWKIINWICYVATILLYGGWLSAKVLPVQNAPYAGALIFGTLFYIVFFLMNIINNIKARTRFVASEIGILLSNTFLYYLAGMAILQGFHEGEFQGLYTVAVAVFNFSFAFLLFRTQKADRNLVYLLIGLVITFISLAIPVQLKGNYITMFWALEAVLLLWFAQKTGIKLGLISTVVITALMLISLGMDWVDIYQHSPVGQPYKVLLNKGFITGLVCIGGLLVQRLLILKQPGEVPFKYVHFKPLQYRKILGFALGITTYLVLFLELHYQVQYYFDSPLNRTILIGLFNLAFLAALFLLATRNQQPILSTIVTFLGGLMVVLYTLHYNLAVNHLLQAHFLKQEPEITGFWFHYGSLALFIVLLWFIYRFRKVFEDFHPGLSKFLVWGFSLVIVFVASSELLNHVLFFNLPAGLDPGMGNGNLAAERSTYLYELKLQTYKVGFPILWGICAFAGMFIGLKIKDKQLRIVALSLFAITLLKLFLFDIRGISEGGKIAAFICLGVLLLVISFMYQNLKKLILTDEAGNEKEETL